VFSNAYYIVEPWEARTSIAIAAALSVRVSPCGSGLRLPPGLHDSGTSRLYCCRFAVFRYRSFLAKVWGAFLKVTPRGALVVYGSKWHP
jgi:hypothetical protein